MPVRTYARQDRPCTGAAAGKSLQAYADEAEVPRETVRWRLKQVLATGTHRQTELVRLV
jgi:hypothetical protein